LLVERSKPTGLEGRLHSDPEANAIWKEWNETLFNSKTRSGDGENFDGLVERCDSLLQMLQQRPESEIVVVTHGWFLRTLVARVLFGADLTGEALRSFQQHIEMENTGLTVLKYGAHDRAEGWYLWIYNDHTHLG